MTAPPAEPQEKAIPAADKTTAAAKKGKVEYIGPKKATGEIAIGVAHIYSTKNDTIVHVTDLSGAETLCKMSGGIVAGPDRDEGTPYAAMQVVQIVAEKLRGIGIDGLHIKISGKGGNTRRLPSQGAQSALRAFARGGIKIGRIEDVTPLPHDSTRRKGGRRGRRL
jgi:small subunit ribosomal protein S14e